MMTKGRPVLAATIAMTVAALAAAARAPRAALDGRDIFVGKGNCSTCHGMDATGTRMAPDLTDSDWLHIDGEYESIAALVKRGVPEPREASIPMPARGGTDLDDAEVGAVARYVYEISH